MTNLQRVLQFNRFSQLCNFCRVFPSVKWSSTSAAGKLLHQSLTDHDLDLMERNILLRQHKNNVPVIRLLLKELQQSGVIESVQKQLEIELSKVPNNTHPRLAAYGNEPRELMRMDASKPFGTVKEFSEISKRMNLFRMDHLGNYTGHKSYYLMGPLALLEQALVDYALTTLKNNHFQLISVPDILPKDVIEACGMQVDGDRTQVYKLDSGKCLSGTSEMALAGFFSDQVFHQNNLPIKVAAVSRCYRAETSGLHEEKGIYRVHQFTKVEMFAICSEEQSEQMIESFKVIEIGLFRNLGLNLRLLDMSANELGSPAYQKYDIETWMPGRQMWGEISSCSNCTDYQARRLNIRYHSSDSSIRFAHTINGTAAAIPRLLVALIEANQDKVDSITIPTPLRSFMGQKEITKDKRMPEIKLIKYIKSVS